MSLVDDVRDWVGSEPDDSAIQAALERFTDVGADEGTWRASLSILRRRRADLDGTGSRSFAVAGDASWGAISKDAITGIDAKIRRLCELLGEPVESGLPAMTSTPILPRACTPPRPV